MYAYGKNISSIAKEFEEIVKEALLRYPDAANLIASLDAKSSNTFTHSVNVALEFYFQIAGHENLSREELVNWTLGALLHDTGKLETPTSILHAFRPLTRPETEVMMAHSIQSYEILKDLNIPKEVVVSALAHHMKSDALHKEGFEGVEYSKDTWAVTFKEGYIRSIVDKAMPWMTKKDIRMIDILELTDTCEALRSGARSYKPEIHWGDKNELGTVNYFVNSDALAGKLDMDIANTIHEIGFQNMFNVFLNLRMDSRVREILAAIVRDQDFVLSDDKLREIMSNPEVGRVFATPTTDKDGNPAFVIRQSEESDSYLVLQAYYEDFPNLYDEPTVMSKEAFESFYQKPQRFCQENSKAEVKSL